MARDLFAEAGITGSGGSEAGAPRDLFAEAGMALPSGGESNSVMDAVRQGVSGLWSSYGEGAGSLAAGAGEFLQAPAANTLAGLSGLRAGATKFLVGRDVAERKFDDVMESAQDTAAFARDARAQNVARNGVGALLGKTLEESGQSAREYWRESKAQNAPEMVRQQEEIGRAEGFIGKAGALLANPLGTAGIVAQSMPDLMVGAGAGSLAAKGAMAVGAARGLGKEAIEAAATRAAGSVGLVTEAASSALHTKQQVVEFVHQQPYGKLYENSARYRELFQTHTPEEARAQLAEELSQEAAIAAGLWTGLMNKVTGSAEAIGKTVATGKTTGKEFFKGTAKEALEEGTQNPGEEFAAHAANRQVDPSQTYDFGGALAEGIVTGGAMGAGMHGAGYVGGKITDARSVPAADATPPVASPAAGEVDAADVLGGAVPLAARPEPSEAEKALLAPKPITALDRVAEIDQRLSSPELYNPTAPALQSEQNALQSERDTITASWPRSVPGLATSFATEAGVRLDGRYALMEADDITASHDVSLRPTPTYPTELQPRERERHASEMQVSGIVQKLDPARLGESADASTGAPIVGADGLVESGNARSIALKRVYQANGQKADDYRQFLRDNATRFGITAEEVDALKKPMLVRVRETPVNRAEFARQANQATVAQMSSSEQAKSDAARMDGLDDLRPDESGDFTNGASRPFVRRFLARLPATEQSGMIDAAGNLSQTGYARIRNAVLAMAYGDSPVLLRMVESLDDNTRNLTKALMQVAPQVAKTRQAIAEGALFDSDITPDLMAAVEELSDLRDKGVSVQEALAQAGMFGDKLSPEARELLAFLDENMRRPRRIAEFIQRYMDALEAAGHPGQGSLLDEATAPGKDELIAAARREQNADEQIPDAGRARIAGDQTTGAKDRGQPGDAPGDQGGVEGDAAAGRVRAEADLADALADMGAVARQYAGVFRLLPEDTPGLHETLVKLFDAAFRLGYYKAKDAIRFVKQKLRENADTKKLVNFIKDASFEKAAAQALENRQGDEGDMFGGQTATESAETAAPSAEVVTQPPEPETPAAQAETPAAETKNSNRIDDTGENLWYNRRNRGGAGIKWGDVEDLNDTLKVQQVKKTKVWPRPDYEQLIADGMHPFFARILKAVYDGIAVEPVVQGAASDEALQRYIATVQKVREAVFAWAQDRQANKEFVDSALAQTSAEMRGTRISMIDLANSAQAMQTAILARVWPEEMAKPVAGRFRRGAAALEEARVIGGNKALRAMQPDGQDIRKFLKEVGAGWPAKREAWQVQGYRVLAPGEYAVREPSPVTRYNRDTGKSEPAGGTHYRIEPKQGRGSWGRTDTPFSGDKFLLVLDGGSFVSEFDSREAAIEAAREKVKREKSSGQDLRGMNLEAAERSGPARREADEDVSAERLMEHFGFRGVNFGREGWINQAERQAYLNHAYDGLLDLADILNVPPKALSLNGALGIAFGAQGRGGNAAAHFVPGVNEINLTKTKGAGTLAHEWGHALDHYFATLAGLAKEKDAFLSEHADRPRRETVVVNGRQTLREVPLADGLRPEILAQFKAIVDAMEKRPITASEQAIRDAEAKARARKTLDSWLASVRRQLDGRAKPDQFAEFDQLAEQMRNGDLGEGYVKASNLDVPPVVAALRNAVKEVTGRLLSADETKAVQGNAEYVRFLLNSQEAGKGHVPQTVTTDYAKASAAADKSKGGKAYWRTRWEMFARAFELYVADQLAERQQANTFLSDAVERAAATVEVADTSSAFARGAGATKDVPAYPYPRGAERQAINTAFGTLVGEIKTKETEQGVAMLSRGAGRGMAMRDLKAVVDRVAKGFKNLPTVHVFESPTQAPKELRDYITEQGAWDDVEGAFHEGEIYLFASGLTDEARAEWVLATHEITHYGLRGAVGKDLDAALQHVWLNNGKVRTAAAALRERYKLSSNVEAVEEVLADLPTGDLARLTGWRKVVKAVRNWLSKVGAKALAERLDAWLTSGMDAQQQADLFVADLVGRAREWVKSGKATTATSLYMGGTRLADPQEGGFAEAVRQVISDSIAGQQLQAYPVPVMDHTPATLRAFGWDDLPVSMNPKEIDKVHFDHGMTVGRIAQLVPETLERPSLMLRSATQPGRMVMITNEYGEKPVLLVVAPEADTPAGKRQLVVSMYPKNEGWDWVARQIRAGNLLYRDPQSPVAPKISGAVADAQKTFAQKGRLLAGPIPESGAVRDKLKGPIPKSGPGFLSEGYTVLLPSDLRKWEAENGPRLSRAAAPEADALPPQSVAQRADAILEQQAGTPRPLDAALKGVTQTLRLDRLTAALYDKAAFLLDRFTPEQVKAGVVADYGIPEAVIDQRAGMQGRMRVQLRRTGELVEKLATLTRAESRVAYEWMNANTPEAADYFLEQLPPESVKTMAEVEKMIDQLSREAVRLGQLDPEAFKRNRYAYLRRSYVKHTQELTAGETKSRQRAIAVLGDQYKGRGMTDSGSMKQIQNGAPEWWNRKLQAGKADKQLKGEKLIRLERREVPRDKIHSNFSTKGKLMGPFVKSGSAMADTATGTLPGINPVLAKGKLMEVAFWPADEPIPAKYSTWDQAGTWEVRDTKGDKLILWRDFTKQEREAMGEIDEARYAIAKTLHGMIHDVEVGRYLEWLSQRYAKKEGEAIDGKIVEASERMRDTFAPGEWVKVPETKIPGTSTTKYGILAGRYLPGPIWNDVRQIVGGRFKPLGETYAAILSAWKTSKTALSPAVHMNNVMANVVMADWHDVTAGHITKALRLILAAHERDGKGALGRAGNAAARAGIADREAAAEILNRFGDSGGSIGTWATQELQKEQLEPLLKALEAEIATAGEESAQVGAMVALQKLLQLKLPSAWDAFKPTKAGQALTTEARNMIALYEAEDQVFRLAAWLKAKEDGANDIAAGKVARKSFLDYHINAPWIQAMRSTAFPFFAFTYRAVPMLAETAAKKPWKLMKLGLLAGLVNAMGYAVSGGDEDDERKWLPEEKAGRVFGLVPKLIRMPWNDIHGQPVFLDIRRFVPVGDIFDAGASHAATPILPAMVPGGPLALLGELMINKVQFTGKAITQETDTAIEKVGKVMDHLYKAFAPNLVFLPKTYAFDSVVNAGKGKTDTFGRELSPTQALLTSVGVKLGSYPKDVLQLNAQREAQFKLSEIDRNITALKRERQRSGLSQEEFEAKIADQLAKKRKVAEEFREKGR